MLDLETLLVSASTVSASAARAAKASIGCSGSLGLLLPWKDLEAAAVAQASAEAVLLASYKDQRFRKEPEPRHVPETLELIGLPDSAASGLTPVTAHCAGESGP